ncbi:DinB superfamily protein [Actinopolymorpha singaporensis]|uniref:DinB superfamily protein n=2 Tax=Actinopolymorpha singaporensis TaxID=117157 RepID=A0A1H1YKH2_9ACTN|nr:DinB superfamily protein [Actinopolymorpha singaporensis]
MDRQSIHAEMEHARATFQALVSQASPAALGRDSDGTRWTNQQLLFHMLFGYMIVRRLLPLVRTLGRLPDGFSRRFARMLNTTTRPFHVVNYLGSCGGALVFRGARLTRKFDKTVAALHRNLDQETDDALARGMHFPVDWDPFFADKMSLLDVYHFGTQHFDFHQQQLTLQPPGA